MMKGSDPAFPPSNPGQPGLTIRDYVAIQAMKAFIPLVPADPDMDADRVAALAYSYADSLIVQSGK